MSAQIDAAFNYNDLKGLESLKSGARKDNPEAIRAVAQQFESMFIGLIMKSMRDATDVMASDLESSYQTKFYRDMHDEQLTLSLSQSGGFGLADIIYEQMSEAKNPQRFNPFDIDVKSMDDSIRPEIIRPHSEQRSPIDTVSPTSDAAAKPQMSSFGSPDEFISQLMPIAQKNAEKLGVDPKVLLAQAALETGWGQHMIEKNSGQSSNNFFGIKADHRWGGEAAMTMTTEFMDGRAMTVKAPFRAYDSIDEAFSDYVDFIGQSERYRTAVEQANNPEGYVRALQEAGYATDPQYADKILGIINSPWFDQT